MKKLAVAALVMSAFALAPMYAFASNDREEIEEACRQAAMDEGVPADESVDFIADCIAMNYESTESEGEKGAEPAEEPELPSE